MWTLLRSGAYRLNFSITGSRRLRLKIFPFIAARRWVKSSVTTCFTTSSETDGRATSTSVCDVYCFGSCMAANTAVTPSPKAQAGNIHQCLRSTLLTSAAVNSPLRTIVPSPANRPRLPHPPKLHANGHRFLTLEDIHGNLTPFFAITYEDTGSSHRNPRPSTSERAGKVEVLYPQYPEICPSPPTGRGLFSSKRPKKPGQVPQFV